MLTWKKDQFLQCVHELLELANETKASWLYGIGAVIEKFTTNITTSTIWQGWNIWL